MIITNKLNLPNALVKAVSERDPIPNEYHVTELLKPTREIIYTRRYWHDLSIDVSECINTLLGSAAHKILELADPTHAEIPLQATIDGVIIKGRIDRYEDGIITDYKTCRRNHKDFEAWKMQGLIYAYLIYLTQNTKPTELRFYGLVKDAMIIRGDATVIPFIYKITDSDYLFIDSWLRHKIKDIKDDNIAMCSDEEAWKVPDSWALFKSKDSARAVKVIDHEPTAEESEGLFVVHRVGERSKCEHYCQFKNICFPPSNK